MKVYDVITSPSIARFSGRTCSRIDLDFKDAVSFHIHVYIPNHVTSQLILTILLSN